MDRRQCLLGGALLGAAALAGGLAPRVTAPVWSTRRLGAIIPAAFDGWMGSEDAAAAVLPSADDGLVGATYAQQLGRVYSYRGSGEGAFARVRTGERGGALSVLPDVLMVIAAAPAQAGDLSVHRPEACYPAAGFRIVSDREVAVMLPTVLPMGATSRGFDVSARFLTAIAGERVEQVLYWTRIGTRFPTSAWAQRLAVMRSDLAGLVPDGALVRLSVVGVAPPLALAVLRRFCAGLYAASGIEGRALLAGG